MKDSKSKRLSNPPAPSPLYFFGMIGALVYYVQLAEGFWPVVLAFLKAFVWPAFVVYDLLKFMQ